MSKDENPRRVNEMESPSFEGFDTQIASLCTVISTCSSVNSFVFKNKTTKHE